MMSLIHKHTGMIRIKILVMIYTFVSIMIRFVFLDEMNGSIFSVFKENTATVPLPCCGSASASLGLLIVFFLVTSTIFMVWVSLIVCLFLCQPHSDNQHNFNEYINLPSLNNNRMWH